MRKNFLINRSFQLKFVGFMILVGLLTLGSTYAVIFQYFEELQKLATDSGLAENHPFLNLIHFQKEKLDTFFGYLSAINLMIIAISGIWMSHRIAGPIYRVVKWISDPYSINSDSKISFRKNDYFQELAEAVNRLISNR
jgi:hypothetical protein